MSYFRCFKEMLKRIYELDKMQGVLPKKLMKGEAKKSLMMCTNNNL